MKVPFMDLKRVGSEVLTEIKESVNKVIDHGGFIQGPEKKQFEKDFANYCGTKHSIGVDSGTSALELGLRALNINEGDEVITVSNTFYATVAAIRAVGAKPVFVDINPETYLIDAHKAKLAITNRTRAILPVHLYGQPADMDDLLGLKDPSGAHELNVLEDACQAHGASYGGIICGNLGDIAAFSFYPGKNLGAYGDGGAVTTNDDSLAEKVRLLHEYGQRKKYYHDIEGGNHRLDTLQAAVVGTKLKYLNQWNEQRRLAAQKYNEQLGGVSEVKLPKEAANRKHVYHLFVVQVPDRDGLQNYLQEQGVSSGLHYPIPLHLADAFKHLGYKEGDFPVTENAAKHIISLPMFPGITDDEISYTCDKVKDFLKK